MIYLFTISASLSSLFSILLLTKRAKKPEHYFLAAIFLMASFNVMYLFSNYQYGGGMYIPFFSELHYMIPVLYGTAVYFYAKTSIQPNFKLEKKHLIHLSWIIIYVSFFFWQRLANVSIGAVGLIMLYALKPVANSIYLIATLVYLKKIGASQAFSKAYQLHRKWLLWLSIGGLVICGISATGFVLNKMLPGVVPMCGDYLIGSFLGIYFFLLGFVAFKNTEVFQNKWIVKNSDTQLTRKEVVIFNELCKFMEKEKPFLDTHLTIYKLSESTGVSISKLSPLINQYGQANFYDFINAYRVKEVEKKMIDPAYDQFSLLGIALDSGFNSKASFHRVFKKFTGFTPSAFRKQIINSK